MFILALSEVQAQTALQTNQFPEIAALQRGNPLYEQLVSSVAKFNQTTGAARATPTVELFRYKTKRNETLFTISARLSLPHAAIASLNRMGTSDLSPEEELILPNLPGLFVPLTPKTRLEHLLFDRLQPSATNSLPVNFWRDGVLESFRFFPEKDFTPEERKVFLGRMFRTPIEGASISSTFGNRRNPFTGTVVLHAGVDLVAPWGTPVRAIGDGIIDETGVDIVYGNYVYVNHQNGYRSFYAHLSAIKVKKGQAVQSGDLIGNLGNTGQVTGAHLHIELHQNGMAKDPLLYFKP